MIKTIFILSLLGLACAQVATPVATVNAAPAAGNVAGAAQTVAGNVAGAAQTVGGAAATIVAGPAQSIGVATIGGGAISAATVAVTPVVVTVATSAATVSCATTCNTNYALCVNSTGTTNQGFLCTCIYNWGACLINSNCQNTPDFQRFQVTCGNNNCGNRICGISALVPCNLNTLDTCQQTFISCATQFLNTGSNNDNNDNNGNGNANVNVNVNSNGNSNNQNGRCGCYSAWGSCIQAAGCQNTQEYQLFQTTCQQNACSNVCPISLAQESGSASVVLSWTVAIAAALLVMRW
jgi:hypothetical protein